MTWQVPAGVWESIAFREAIDFLRQRVPAFRPTREAIASDAAREAFWISDVATLSVISEVYESINAAIASGQSMQSWAADVRDALAASYPDSMSDAQVDARVNLVFRNSMQRAYGEGRYRQSTDPDVARNRPYFMFDAIMDGRTSDGCRSLNGTILPQDHPFWDRNTPPRHHNCRSGLRTLSARQVERRGGVTADVPMMEADEGFGSRPTTADPYRPSDDRYPPPITAALRERAASRGVL